MLYILGGGMLWIGLFSLAGYFFGDLPVVQDNLHLLLVAIIVVSLLPGVIEVVRIKLKNK